MLPFFDCNVMLGRRSAPRPEDNVPDERILEDLARAGIEGALVRHAYGKEYDPRTGNERLVDACREHPNLVPCFTLLPEGCGDFPGGDALIEMLAQGRAGAATLYPKSQSYGLGETWCGALLSTLDAAGVPLLIDLAETSWTELDGVLRAHPRLEVIVLRVGYRANRWAFPMLARYEGLRIETSLYAGHNGIQEVAARFGAARLIFGSGLPQYDPGGAIASVLYADLPEADKRRIAGWTVQRLLWKGGAR